MASQIEQRGLLTFVSEVSDRSKDGHIVALWRCACGANTYAIKSRVQNGYVKSCGCLARAKGRNTRHGMRGSPEYSSWIAMKRRCLDPNHKDYPRWGGNGISVCKEWASSFEAFYEHIGRRPEGTTLDRIDTYRGYEPGNVRWASKTEQARNRRTAVIVATATGTTRLADYADKLGISPSAALMRLKRGKLEGATHVA